MQAHGVAVDHSTINRWVVKYSPQLEAAFHPRKRPVWLSWRMDETYIKVKGRCTLNSRPKIRLFKVETCHPLPWPVADRRPLAFDRRAPDVGARHDRS
jgi:hypothetical protein